jgi:hypothetical protein
MDKPLEGKQLQEEFNKFLQGESSLFDPKKYEVEHDGNTLIIAPLKKNIGQEELTEEEILAMGREIEGEVAKMISQEIEMNELPERVNTKYMNWLNDEGRSQPHSGSFNRSEFQPSFGEVTMVRKRGAVASSLPVHPDDLDFSKVGKQIRKSYIKYYGEVLNGRQPSDGSFNFNAFGVQDRVVMKLSELKQEHRLEMKSLNPYGGGKEIK